MKYTYCVLTQDLGFIMPTVDQLDLRLGLGLVHELLVDVDVYYYLHAHEHFVDFEIISNYIIHIYSVCACYAHSCMCVGVFTNIIIDYELI